MVCRQGDQAVAEQEPEAVDVVIVTYGNGISTALRAAQTIMSRASEEKSKSKTNGGEECDPCGRRGQSIFECSPSTACFLPAGTLSGQSQVVFADICKQRLGPLSAISVQLHNDKVLKGKSGPWWGPLTHTTLSAT